MFVFLNLFNFVKLHHVLRRSIYFCFPHSAISNLNLRLCIPSHFNITLLLPVSRREKHLISSNYNKQRDKSFSNKSSHIMPKKGMKTLFLTFKSKQSSWPSPSSGDASSSASNSLASTPRRNTRSMIERSIDVAELMVTKWNPDTSGYAQVTSLFHESHQEAMDFIKCVFNLQKSMHLIGRDDPFGNMERAQNLMQIAMKRLQKEFYQILSTNRDHLDPESVSTRSSRTSSISSISEFDDTTTEHEIAKMEQVSMLAMDNLRSIADCMISSGYGKECIKIYTIIRKSIIDEGLYKLGVEKTSQNNFNKLSWESQDLKIQQWLHASRIALKTLFAGERILCDHVFEASKAIQESCFIEISRDAANLLFTFPEIVTKSKKSPEKMLRVLDMYTAIVEHWNDIDAIFSSESSSSVRLLAMKSLPKLADAIRTMILDFESAVQKDSSKVTPAGGGVDPLTIFVMNNLSCLSDYASVVNEILSNYPLPGTAPSRDPNFEVSSLPGDAPLSAISVHIAWVILFLLCKIDERSRNYSDVSTSHLFIANNLQHVLSTVRRSNLKFILGENWIQKQEEKISHVIDNYYEAAWGGVSSNIPANITAAISTAEAKERFRKFNAKFEEAYRKQSACVVEDQKLRNDLKQYVAGKIVPRYREFFRVNKSRVGGTREGGGMSLAVRFTPEDVTSYLSDLYYDDGGSESGSSLSFRSPSFSSNI